MKLMYIICAHLLFALDVGAFIASVEMDEYILAGGCAVAYSLLKAMYTAIERIDFNDV